MKKSYLAIPVLVAGTIGAAFLLKSFQDAAKEEMWNAAPVKSDFVCDALQSQLNGYSDIDYDRGTNILSLELNDQVKPYQAEKLQDFATYMLNTMEVGTTPLNTKLDRDLGNDGVIEMAAESVLFGDIDVSGSSNSILRLKLSNFDQEDRIRILENISGKKLQDLLQEEWASLRKWDQQRFLQKNGIETEETMDTLPENLLPKFKEQYLERLINPETILSYLLKPSGYNQRYGLDCTKLPQHTPA